MSLNNKRTFWSFDRSLGLILEHEAIEEMLKHCRESGKLETGGVLIGKYSDELNCAIVAEVTGPPRDSVRMRTTFERGTYGLKALLQKRFTENKTYYLGEWHFHPYASPEPSGRDISQLKEFANAEKLKCPEPSLIIVGGNPRTKWSMSAHVVFQNGSAVELLESGDF